MNRISFHVLAAGKYRSVELTFGTVSEVRRLRMWRKTLPATDAAEFAALAAKRWFYYTREGASAGSLEQLRAAIARNERSEIAFLLVASADWTKRYRFLALAYCRRTWCHHLALDFLAVRPSLLFESQPIRGIGTGILASLAGIADSLGITKIWGEATASSAPFYEKVLGQRPVQDLFVLQEKKIQRFRQQYLAKLKRRLAEHEFRTQYLSDESESKTRLAG